MELKTTWKFLCLFAVFFTVNSQEATWLKVNTSPVCFGARNEHFGTFTMPLSGDLAAVRLVNLYGYVTCDAASINWSFWGCGSSSGQQVDVVITTDTNNVLLPEPELIQSDSLFSIIPGYSANSPQLVMSFFKTRSVLEGQQLRLWFGEDLTDINESDNDGRACVEVYALYI